MAVFDPLGNVVIPGDDAVEPEGTWSDTPNESPSIVTVDYYRQKVVEFQKVMDLLDYTGRDLYDAGTVAYASENPEMIAEYESLQSDFNSKRSAFIAAAEGINFASQGINSMGVQFPSVQIPFGMGKLGLAPLVAAAGAVAGAVALMTWAMGFWRAVQDFARRWQHLSAIERLPESERAGALESFRKLETNAQIAESQASQSPIASLATFGKWAVIGLLGFLAYRTLK